MSFEIVHPEKPTEQDKIDDNDYMLPHQINGVLPDFSSFPGMKARIPILIEEKTFTDQSSVTFSNLNGDQDKEYLLIGKTTQPGGSGEANIILQFNGDTNTANYKGNRHYAGSSQGVRTYSYALLANDIGGGGSLSFIQANIIPVTGTLRHLSALFNGYKPSAPTDQYTVQSSAYYLETATNITSLVLSASLRTFSGTIKLYKLVDITLEDLTPT
jgi:hypothetical protein